VQLEADVENVLKKAVLHAQDRCYRCGAIGHYVSACRSFSLLPSVPCLPNEKKKRRGSI
jgi:hypothetical protein